MAGLIEWTFASGGNYFLSAKLTDDSGFEINGFQATGQNTSDAFIRGLGGFIESGVTGEKFPILIQHNNKLVSLSDHGIPAKHQFHIRAPFKRGWGLPVAKFVSTYGPLTMHFQYDGEDYTRSFTFEEVEAEARRVETFLRPLPSCLRTANGNQTRSGFAMLADATTVGDMRPISERR